MTTKEEEPTALSHPVMDDIALQYSSGLLSSKQSVRRLSNVFNQNALYGRHSEQIELKQAYERVRDGNTKSEFVLLHGPTGRNLSAVLSDRDSPCIWFSHSSSRQVSARRQ